MLFLYCIVRPFSSGSLSILLFLLAEFNSLNPSYESKIKISVNYDGHLENHGLLTTGALFMVTWALTPLTSEGASCALGQICPRIESVFLPYKVWTPCRHIPPQLSSWCTLVVLVTWANRLHFPGFLAGRLWNRIPMYCKEPAGKIEAVIRLLSKPRSKYDSSQLLLFTSHSVSLEGIVVQVNVVVAKLIKYLIIGN